jgi:hypothetical protein
MTRNTPSRRPRRTRAGRRRGFVPRLEALEERTLPSSLPLPSPPTARSP